jgi:hypothetical protein
MQQFKIYPERGLLISVTRLNFICVLALCSFSAIAFAKDKDRDHSKDPERVFDAPFDAVWTACVRTASEKYILEHSEKASGLLTFSTPPSPWSDVKLAANVVVMSVDDKKTSVVVNTQKKAGAVSWGEGGQLRKKFFDAVAQKLKQP